MGVNVEITINNKICIKIYVFAFDRVKYNNLTKKIKS